MSDLGDHDLRDMERLFEAIFGEPPVIRDPDLLRQVLQLAVDAQSKAA